MTSFTIDYSSGNRALLDLLGLGPGSSRVAVGETTVSVHMGWAFRADFPRAAIRSARREERLPFLGWGVHGWKGRWLVNGSSRGLVRIDLDPVQHARVTGVRVQLRELWLSCEQPAALVAALTAATG